MLTMRYEITPSASLGFEFTDSTYENVRFVKYLNSKIVDVREFCHSQWDRDEVADLLKEMFNVPQLQINLALQQYDNFISEQFNTHED